jgi:hypothetical protein
MAFGFGQNIVSADSRAARRALNEASFFERQKAREKKELDRLLNIQAEQRGGQTRKGKKGSATAMGQSQMQIDPATGYPEVVGSLSLEGFTPGAREVYRGRVERNERIDQARKDLPDLERQSYGLAKERLLRARGEKTGGPGEILRRAKELEDGKPVSEARTPSFLEQKYPFAIASTATPAPPTEMEYAQKVAATLVAGGFAPTGIQAYLNSMTDSEAKAVLQGALAKRFPGQYEAPETRRTSQYGHLLNTSDEASQKNIDNYEKDSSQIASLLGGTGAKEFGRRASEGLYDPEMPGDPTVVALSDMGILDTPAIQAGGNKVNLSAPPRKPTISFSPGIVSIEDDEVVSTSEDQSRLPGGVQSIGDDSYTPPGIGQGSRVVFSDNLENIIDNTGLRGADYETILNVARAYSRDGMPDIADALEEYAEGLIPKGQFSGRGSATLEDLGLGDTKDESTIASHQTRVETRIENLQDAWEGTSDIAERIKIEDELKELLIGQKQLAWYETDDVAKRIRLEDEIRSLQGADLERTEQGLSTSRILELMGMKVPGLAEEIGRMESRGERVAPKRDPFQRPPMGKGKAREKQDPVVAVLNAETPALEPEAPEPALSPEARKLSELNSSLESALTNVIKRREDLGPYAQFGIDVETMDEAIALESSDVMSTLLGRAKNTRLGKPTAERLRAQMKFVDSLSEEARKIGGERLKEAIKVQSDYEERVRGDFRDAALGLIESSPSLRKLPKPQQENLADGLASPIPGVRKFAESVVGEREARKLALTRQASAFARLNFDKKNLEQAAIAFTEASRRGELAQALAPIRSEYLKDGKPKEEFVDVVEAVAAMGPEAAAEKFAGISPEQAKKIYQEVVSHSEGGDEYERLMNIGMGVGSRGANQAIRDESEPLTDDQVESLANEMVAIGMHKDLGAARSAISAVPLSSQYALYKDFFATKRADMVASGRQGSAAPGAEADRQNRNWSMARKPSKEQSDSAAGQADADKKPPQRESPGPGFQRIKVGGKYYWRNSDSPSATVPAIFP